MTPAARPPKPPRQAKTPRQRAQEALGVAKRHVDRLKTKRAALDVELNGVRRELDDAVLRRDYLAKHPDLTTAQPSTTPTGDPDA